LPPFFLLPHLLQVVFVMVSYVFAAGSYCRLAPLYVVWPRYPMPVADHKGSVAVRYPLHKVPFVESVHRADGNTKANLYVNLSKNPTKGSKYSTL